MAESEIYVFTKSEWKTVQIHLSFDFVLHYLKEVDYVAHSHI